MKKFLSILLSFSITFTSVSTVSALDIELPKNLDNFTEDVADLINEYEDLSSSESAVFFTAADESETENSESTNRLIVKSTEKIDTLNAINSVSGYNDLYILQFENSEDCQAALEYYSTLSCVKYVQEDGIVTETAIEEAEATVNEAAIDISSQYQSDVFGYTNAKANMGSAAVTIAVVDSGVANDHEYLQGRVIPTGFDSVDNESCYDLRGHGTHVAGIIAANTKSNVKIKPYKVLGADGTGTEAQLYLGIQAAIEDGVDIINLSLSKEGESEVIHEAVQNAYNAGITVVAAAGNDGADLDFTFYSPACYDEVICVVSIDVNKKRASTTNWRAEDTLSAPGVNILSSYLNNTYKIMSGTSMATPFISCCVAYLLASGNYYSPEAAYNTLYKNTQQGATASVHYVVPGQLITAENTCATPIFTYQSGEFSGYLNVKITCDTPGATIMYRTTDMKADEYYEYTGPVRIEKSASFTAYAFCKGYKNSSTAKVTYRNNNIDTSMFIIDENDVLIGYTGTDTEVSIPDYFDGGCVTKIAASAFSGNTNITSLNLSKLTTIIGEGAFEGCTNLNSISGSGVTEIETNAFKNCSSLTTISMTSVLTIGERAFLGCTSLSSLKLSKATTIGANAFENSGITTFTSSNLTTIGDNAFINTPIQTISLSTVTHIGEKAFAYCNSLTDITLTDSIIALGDSAFANCENLASVTLTGVTTLGNSIFTNCTALNTITADSLATIGNYTFNGCSSLEALTLPALKAVGDCAFAQTGIKTLSLPSATTLGINAFGNCASLKTVTLSAITDFVYSAFNGSTNVESLSLSKATNFDFGNGKLSDIFPTLTTFTDKSITNVPDYFFDGCSKLSSITLGNVVTVGNYSFRGTALISIPFNSAKNFGEGAFSDMPYLEEVKLDLPELLDFSIFAGSTNVKKVVVNNLYELPGDFRCRDYFPNIEHFECENVISIPDYAFKGCSKLYYYDFFYVEEIGCEAFRGTAIEDPSCSRVETIGERAFADCTNLGEVSLASLYEINMNVFENSEHTVTDLNLNLISYEDEENIATLNFQKFTNLQGIGLDSQKHIPDNAFKDLHSLNSVVLGACETIGENAFANCTALKSVSLLEATAIGKGAFSGCTGLESFYAYSLTSLDFDVFNDCTNLKKLSLDSMTEFPVDEEGRFNLSNLENLVSFSANSLEIIPSNFLKGCKKLTTVSFSKAQQIGDYAFYDTGLTTYTMPAVKVIGDYAFFSTNISTFSFNKSTSIGKYAFSECNNLPSITITANTAIGEGAFSNCNKVTEITLNNIRSLPVNAISGCPNVTYLDLTQITELPIEEDGSTYVSDKPELEEFIAEYVATVPDEYFINNPKLFNAIMTNLEDVGNRAFMNTSLMYLPSDYLYTIGDYAFYGTSISEVYTECIERIGDYAFANCTALTSAVINNIYAEEDGIEIELGTSAFEGCSKLTRVALYMEDIALPNGFFKNCTSLSKVYATKSWKNTTVNNLADIKSIGEEAFYGCSAMSINKIKPSSLESIEKNAFANVTTYAGKVTLPNLKYVGENALGSITAEHLILENAEIIKDIPDCEYVLIGSDIKEFSCDNTDTTIYAYEDSVVDEFCKSNNLNFANYNSIDPILRDVEPLLTGYDYILHFEAIGFNTTYEWYACNNPDRSDAVLIETTLEDPQTIDPIAIFFDNYEENKYTYFYCVATSTENGNVLEIPSSLCKNIFATIKGTENTFIDFLGVIYTSSPNNVNTLDNIFSVDGDIRVTPSYATDTQNCYGTGSIVEILNGDEVAIGLTLVVQGDINGDGVVNVIDLTEIEKAVNGHKDITDTYSVAADANRDETFDITDYQTAVNIALSA